MVLVLRGAGLEFEPDMDSGGTPPSEPPSPQYRFRPLDEVTTEQPQRRGHEPKWSKVPSLDQSPPPVAPAPVRVPGGWRIMIDVLLTANQRLMVGIGLVSLLILALALSLPAMGATLAVLVVALVLTAALVWLAEELMKLQLPQTWAVAVTAGIAVAVLAVTLLVLVPRWQQQGQLFSQQLRAWTLPPPPAEPADWPADELAGGETQAAPATEPAAAARIGGWVSEVRERLAGVIQTVAAWADEVAQGLAAARVRLFLQLTLAVGTLLAVPVLRPLGNDPAALTAVEKWWRATANLELKFVFRIGYRCASRLGKAMVLAVVAGAGFSAAGVTAPWFLAGGVFVLAVVTRWVAVGSVLLALVMVPWGGELARPLLGALVTGIVLDFAERKLHWYWCRRPALRAGLIPPAGEAVAETTPARPGLLRLASHLVRLITSVVLLGVIGMLLWTFLPRYQATQRRLEAVRQAEATAATADQDTAAAAYLALLETYPDERVALLGLVKVYAQDEYDLDRAREYAERYAKWEPAPPQSAGWRENVFRHAMKFFEPGGTELNRAAGYEQILSQIATWEGRTELLEELGRRAVALRPTSAVGLAAVATACYTRDELDQALEYAQRAVQAAGTTPGMHLLLAKVYFARKEWTKAILECDAELGLNPADPETETIRATATMAQQRNLQ